MKLPKYYVHFHIFKSTKLELNWAWSWYETMKYEYEWVLHMLS